MRTVLLLSLFLLSFQLTAQRVPVAPKKEDKEGFLSRIHTGIGKTFFGVGQKSKRKLFISPVLSWNTFDRFTFGASVYNSPATNRKFQYALMPFFSTGPKSWSGIADFRYHIYTDSEGLPPKFAFGLSARSAHTDTLPGIGSAGRFIRIAPSASFYFFRQGQTVSRLVYNSVILMEQAPTELADSSTTYHTRHNHRLVFNVDKDGDGGYLSLKFSAEAGWYRDAFARTQGYLQTTLQVVSKIYFMDDKEVGIRFFAGAIPLHSNRRFGEMPLALAQQSSRDYYYDHMALGHGKTSGSLLPQQLVPGGGGFKTPLRSGSIVGVAPESNVVLASLNLYTDMPFKFILPMPNVFRLRLYLDAGYYRGIDPATGDFVNRGAVNGGLWVDLFNDWLGLYFPIASTSDLAKSLKAGGNYFSRIGFTLRLDKFNPLAKMRRKYGKIVDF